MIDKIELRLPRLVDFTPLVTAQLRHPGMAKPTQHYGGALDLRPYGLDAMVHYRKRRGEATHKLEIFETGGKAFSEIDALIASVVEIDSSRLELMRIDLCADVPDVPVLWFHEHARIKHKQFARRIGEMKSDVISRAAIETISAGRRPNVVRIYNKVAEWKMQLAKMNRALNPDADELDFEQTYGISPTATLTRVERQYGGGRLPKSIETFGEIAHAAEIDPFEPMELVAGSTLPPRVEDHDFNEWLVGSALRHEAEKSGMQDFRRWLNKHAHGNGARMMKRYAPFMPGAGRSPITSPGLAEIYRKSTAKQLSA